MTTAPTEQKLEQRGHHADWCTNHDAEFTRHSEREPYCSRIVAGFDVIGEGDVVQRQGWVSPTRPFSHGPFTAAELEEQNHLYTGVEIVIETWRGPGTEWVDEKIRITSDVARSLAAALVRAADIEQGLTR